MKKPRKKNPECLDETSPEDMEEDVSDKKNDRIENNYEGKEAECLDDTSPDKMEGDVSDINDNNNEEYT